MNNEDVAKEIAYAWYPAARGNPDGLAGEQFRRLEATVLRILVYQEASYCDMTRHYNDIIDKQQAELSAYREALIWCGGSEDFSPTGKARIGWETVVQPLLKDCK